MIAATTTPWWFFSLLILAGATLFPFAVLAVAMWWRFLIWVCELF